MRIRYVGAATVRVWEYNDEPLRWTPENKHTLDITDANLATELLTHPPGDFAIAFDDELTALDGIGAQRAAELTLLDIASLEDIAELDEDGITRIERAMSVSAAQVRDWRAQALAELRRKEAERGLEADSSEKHFGVDAQASEEV